MFLAGLDSHPVGHAFETFRLEVSRHGKIKVLGKQFGVDLLVKGFEDFCIKHDGHS
jgi:hypothetical protein